VCSDGANPELSIAECEEQPPVAAPPGRGDAGTAEGDDGDEAALDMAVTAVSRFERFFRTVAGLDVDKDDLRRYTGFINDQLYALVLMGEATARANARDIIEPHDLPITKGLQERIHEFEKLDQDLDFHTILDQITAWPPLALSCSDDTTARFPVIVGGLSIALARTMKIIDPDLKVPGTVDWERAFAVFNLML
jgi:hypothetical protein